MERIDFIKRAISDAAGFNLSGDQLVFPTGACETLYDMQEDYTFIDVWEPLIIQYAIDGVNSRTSEVKIRQDEAGVYVYSVETGTNMTLWRYRKGSKLCTWNNCRKEALQYIYDREALEGIQ